MCQLCVNGHAHNRQGMKNDKTPTVIQTIRCIRIQQLDRQYTKNHNGQNLYTQLQAHRMQKKMGIIIFFSKLKTAKLPKPFSMVLQSYLCFGRAQIHLQYSSRSAPSDIDSETKIEIAISRGNSTEWISRCGDYFETLFSYIRKLMCVVPLGINY